MQPNPGRLAALLLLAAALAGCGGERQAGPTPPPRVATSTASPGAQAPAATPQAQPAPEGSFQNPVLRRNFPDPALIEDGGVFYAFATNSDGRNVQAARSADLVRWEMLPDAMPALPKWVRLGRPDVWAPEVIRAGERFVLYFTARHAESGRQCIGAAVGDSPAGRFRPASDQPLVCQVEEGGSIDPSPFADGDQLYLYWKNDGNCCGQRTYLYVQPLAPDGLSLQGEPARLVSNDQVWEGGVVEAPTMVRHGDGYFLFFSANGYDGLRYAVGYAVCAAAAGPCEDAPENPILGSKLDAPPLVVGPGHQDIVELGDQTWIVYHAWEVLNNGTRGQRRFLWLDRLDWVDGRPDVAGPTVDPQPAPDI